MPIKKAKLTTQLCAVIGSERKTLERLARIEDSLQAYARTIGNVRTELENRTNCLKKLFEGNPKALEAIQKMLAASEPEPQPVIDWRNSQKDNRYLKQSIGVLELSVRSFNCLRNAGVMTIGDLCEWTSGDLLQIKLFGKKCLREIIEDLESIDLRLKPSC